MKKVLTIILVLFIGGCAHVVSKELRDSADPTITFKELLQNPDKYKGKTVILGGTIISSKNTKEGTYIEVIQHPLDATGKPEDTDVTEGRFLIFYPGFLDTGVYTKGRNITVAGEVLGKKVMSLGEIEYTYPLLKSKEIHLLEPERRQPVQFGIELWKIF